MIDKLYFNKYYNVLYLKGGIMAIYWIRTLLSLNLFKSMNALVSIFGFLIYDITKYFFILFMALIIFSGLFQILYMDLGYKSFNEKFQQLSIQMVSGPEFD